MKPDLFSKALLSVIAVALSLIAFEGLQKNPLPVQAAGRGFDYKFIVHQRDNDYNGRTVDTYWEDDGHTMKTGIVEWAQQLGAQGWELVTVDPRSTGGSGGFFAHPGATSDELFVFKRPKS